MTRNPYELNERQKEFIRGFLGASYVVAVPSYKRAGLLGAATLATLDAHGVDRDRVTVYVADEAEREEYVAVNPGWRIEVTSPGLVASRRAYNERHAATTPILNMDDDVLELQTVDDEGKRLVKWGGSIDQLVAMGFGLSRLTAAKLWGINAAANAFYMDDAAVVGLRYICGVLHGTYGKDPVVTSTLRPDNSNGEDFITTCEHYQRDGAVVRLNWITAKTRYFGPGGMQAEHGDVAARKADYRAFVPLIADRYSAIASYVEKGDTGNIKLKPITTQKFLRLDLEDAVR